MSVVHLVRTLRTGAGPWVVTVGDASGAALAAAAARAQGAVVATVTGPRSKAELLDAVGVALGFPAWWGRNWDALEECLRALDDVPTVLVWSASAAPDGDDAELFAEIWRAAASGRDTPLVLVRAWGEDGRDPSEHRGEALG